VVTVLLVGCSVLGSGIREPSRHRARPLLVSSGGSPITRPRPLTVSGAFPLTSSCSAISGWARWCRDLASRSWVARSWLVSRSARPATVPLPGKVPWQWPRLQKAVNTRECGPEAGSTPAEPAVAEVPRRLRGVIKQLPLVKGHFPLIWPGSEPGRSRNWSKSFGWGRDVLGSLPEASGGQEVLSTSSTQMMDRQCKGNVKAAGKRSMIRGKKMVASPVQRVEPSNRELVLTADDCLLPHPKHHSLPFLWHDPHRPPSSCGGL